MKNLICLIVSLFSLSSFAQTMKIDGKTYKKGDRIETADLTAYEGVWVWKSNNQHFKLKLFKSIIDFAGNKDYTMEILAGQYQYKLNNVDKYNSLDDKTASNITAGKIENGKVIFYIIDGTTKFRGEGTMELIDKNKLRWHVNPSKAENWKLTKDQIMSFSIPLDMVLSKDNN